MSTLTAIKPLPANLRDKDIQRVIDKITKLRNNDQVLEAIPAESKESRRLARANVTLGDSINTLVHDKILGDYFTQYVDCRDLGHQWKLKSQSVEDGRLYRTTKCNRCSTTKDEIISRYGQALIHPRYTHPDGYLINSSTKGIVGNGKSFWRAIQFSTAAGSSS